MSVRLCSHTLLSAKPDKHKASLTFKPFNKNKKINKSSIPDKYCLSNKFDCSPVANQQSCSLFIRCLFIVLSLVPTWPMS